jgi:hypothetical protein
MTDQHPITPPPELVQQWYQEADSQLRPYYVYIATQSARWGADQELEACCAWLAQSASEPYINALRIARRKPPSLNSVALQMLGTIERDAHYIPEITDTIRRALEALDD